MRVQSAVIDFVFPPPFPEPIADSTPGPFCDFPIGFLQVHCEGIVGYGVVPVSHTLALLLLSFASISSISQALSSPQEKLNLHSRMAQQYLEEQRPELAVPEFQAIIAL